MPFSRRTHPLLSRLRSHHDRASGHFFSDALRFRRAREVGREGSRLPLASVSRSTSWSSGSLAVCLTYPSAASFPEIPLCAGHQWISISTEGSCSRRASVQSLCVLSLRPKNCWRNCFLFLPRGSQLPFCYPLSLCFGDPLQSPFCLIIIFVPFNLLSGSLTRVQSQPKLKLIVSLKRSDLEFPIRTI